MIQKKKLTNYVSDLDKFLTDFDKSHELSATQRKEKAKFKRIYQLRDVVSNVIESKKKLWEDF